MRLNESDRHHGAKKPALNLGLGVLVFIGWLSHATGLAAAGFELPLTNGVALRVGGLAARSPVHVDPVEARLVAGNWVPPTPGASLDPAKPTELVWSSIDVGTNRSFGGELMRGGYVSSSVLLPEARVLLLEAAGHNLVYINGELRPGDPYSTGSVRLPFRAKEGPNEFLFQVNRGRLNAKIVEPKAPIYIELVDATLPDLLLNQRGTTWAGILVVNATTNEWSGLEIESRVDKVRPHITSLPRIPALSLRKVPVELEAAPADPSKPARLTLVLREKGSPGARDTAAFDLRVRTGSQTRKTTFVSELDGSVQYYAVNPSSMASSTNQGPAQALFVSLHGASVEAIGQADAYSAKSWGTLVAPTNRRPYGFDWEDWGRLDAMEVVGLATRAFKPDPARIYLTGHSMGGHGTWQLGVTFPDRFAAIGPSAGWVTFNSYANGPRFTNNSPVADILRRAASSSDTLSMRSNLLHHGVYIVHGDADDNVPVSEARTMRDALSQFHHDWELHEQPGAGHWWDVSDEPGADCVDWQPMFDLFARHARPAASEVRRVRFTTVNPGVSASSDWATVETQTTIQMPSSIDLTFDPHLNRVRGVSSNVERLRINLLDLHAREGLEVILDGRSLGKSPAPAGTTHLWFQRVAGNWSIASELNPGLKGPHRSGPFKAAFNHRMIFVYGTSGTLQENDWSYRKAKLDAEAFWYRGNGTVDIISDKAFDPRAEPDRSVIVYGNTDCNSAWKTVLSGSPIAVRRDSVRVGERMTGGDDLAVVFLRPRPRSSIAHVGVIAGTGAAGMRLLDRLPVFIAGVAYPDWVVMDSTTLVKGVDGVRSAGFFGNDWSMERAQAAWR